MIRKKRNAIEKSMRNDIADLLRNGFDMIAYQRVRVFYLNFIQLLFLDVINNFQTSSKR